MRYVERIGFLPNLRCDIVTPPDFFESFAKYPWAYMSVSSPIIFMASLLAPTVPSEPKPQNLHLMVPSEATFIFSLSSSEVKVTSSFIPMVNLSLGL